jgi:UDP-glucose 4-epimerase
VGRLVVSWTCAVYGTPERVPVGEDAPVHPESPYGESKAMTERVLGWYDRCLGLRSVSLRYFNAAGAWPDGSIGEDWTVTINLVPLLVKPALGRRGPLEVFGADYPTPDGTANRDERAIGRPVPYEAVARRPGDPVALYADTARAKEVLGWTARLGLDEILASAWDVALNAPRRVRQLTSIVVPW